MKTHKILHILRNPYGWGDEKIREARLAACDLIEQLERERKFVGYGMFNDGKLVACSQQEITASAGGIAIDCIPVFIAGNRK